MSVCVFTSLAAAVLSAQVKGEEVFTWQLKEPGVIKLVNPILFGHVKFEINTLQSLFY